MISCGLQFFFLPLQKRRWILSLYFESLPCFPLSVRRHRSIHISGCPRPAIRRIAIEFIRPICSLRDLFIYAFIMLGKHGSSKEMSHLSHPSIITLANPHYNKKATSFSADGFGPSGESRTHGLLNPIQARYQTALHPDVWPGVLTGDVVYYISYHSFCQHSFSIFSNFFQVMSLYSKFINIMALLPHYPPISLIVFCSVIAATSSKQCARGLFQIACRSTSTKSS